MRRQNLISILVVDDSTTIRNLLRTMLGQLGFTNIDEAADGQEALSKILSGGYALIISDWNMEPMGGLALLHEIQKRRLQKPSFNRFIFMTTDRSWGTQATAKVDGADGFIIKPFKADALRAKIESALGNLLA